MTRGCCGLLLALVLAGCAPVHGDKVRMAQARRGVENCMADAWLSKPRGHPPVRYDHGRPSRRNTQPVLPPPPTPDIGRISRDCQ